MLKYNSYKSEVIKYSFSFFYIISHSFLFFNITDTSSMNVYSKWQVVSYKDEDTEDGVTSVAFSGSGRVLFVGCDDHTVRIFDSVKVEKIC